MGIRVQCPKCWSEGARYERDRQDVWLRCLCGYAKVVESTLNNDIVITHPDTEVMLPRRDSKLYGCLAVLVGLARAKTGDITEQSNVGKRDKQSNSDIASQLTVLRYKGLVKVVEEHKGLPGGSTWEPTDAAMKLFSRK